MASPKRVLIHSLVSTISPETMRSRRDDLETIDNRPRRAGALALHDFAVSHPERAARMIGLRYRRTDLSPLGVGRENHVFRLSFDTVLKVDWMSVALGNDKQRQYAHQRQAEHETMVSALGEQAVPHLSTNNRAHPLFPDRNAIHVTQQYTEFRDDGLFQATSAQAMGSIIMSMTAATPSIHDQLGTFLDASRRLHADHDLLPDVVGQGNVILDGDQLRVLDGQPLGLDKFETQLKAHAQLDMLDEALALI
jgi:hypothetical protein